MGNINFLTPTSWQYASGDAVGNYDETDNGYGIVEFFPTFKTGKKSFVTVKGVMKEALSLSFDSEWTDMESINIPIVSDTIEEAGNVVGAAPMLVGGGEWGYVWKSQKVWKKSGYVKVDGTFIVVDWNGDGTPLKAAHDIIQYCTPGSGFVNDNGATELAAAFNGMVTSATSLAAKGANTAIPGTSEMVQNASDNFVKNMTDFATLKDSPPPITLKIGKYFIHTDMVITNVSTKFSKEVSVEGPLSVEITFAAESRTRTSGIKDIGLLSKSSTSGRVVVQKVD